MEGYLSYNKVSAKEHADGSGRLYRDVVKPLGKVGLEVVFGDGGLFRRVSVSFTVIRAPSPYNIILERAGLKTLQTVSSMIHSMVKFPTPRGIATLVTRTVIISECRRLEKKQMVEKEAQKSPPRVEIEPREVSMTEEILVNMAHPEQLVTIEENLTEVCKTQLKILLKKNMDVFAWEPSDMTREPSGDQGGRKMAESMYSTTGEVSHMDIQSRPGEKGDES
ncbi:hypothetical protein Tco_0755259 [Tanacetum coccineum]